MPIFKKKFRLKRSAGILLAVLVITAVYINRSYAHIFDYDNARQILSADIPREYVLSNGQGQGTFKYAALGDSLTYGFGANDYTGTYPYVLANKLLRDHKEVRVMNLAVAGAVTEEVLLYQLPRAMEEKPQFATLMTGTNDMHDFVSLDKFKKDLELIIDGLKSVNARVLVINIPYLGTNDLILPPHNFLMDSRIKEYNKVIKQTALEKQVKYFDLYSATKPEFEKDPGKYYSYDKFHPSAEGYTLWGELINVD